MAETALTTDDHRTHARKRVLRAAKVVYGDYRYLVDCMIRDLTVEGVRIKAQNPEDIPEEFHLFVGSESKLFPGKVMWRKGKELGVKFVAEPINLVNANDPRLKRFAYL